MDVFQLREDLIGGYRRYATSFLSIKDQRVRHHVEEAFDKSKLWPHPQIGLNPAFKAGGTVDELVVPEERTASLIEMGAGRGLGAVLHPGPLYRTPMVPILALAACMPAVGQARAALQSFRVRMSERVLFGTASKQADKPAAQIRLARAEIDVTQTELLVRDVVRDVMAVRDNATQQDRTRWLACCAIAVERSKRVLQSIAEASGASAHFQNHPLQRAVRDVNTLACHAIFDCDSRLENHGRSLLGLEPIGLF